MEAVGLGVALLAPAERALTGRLLNSAGARRAPAGTRARTAQTRQEQAGLSPWGTVVSAMGSFPHGASEASLRECLGRPQRDCPQGSVSSSGTSSVCWVLLCTRTQPCLSLFARTATPNSISATAFSGPSYRESMSPQLASGNLVQRLVFSLPQWQRREHVWLI